MDSNILIDILGWIGAISFLVAYALVSAKKWEGDSLPYQLLNLAGEVHYAGQTYPTPSAAGKQVATTWKEVNGWTFWRYLDPTTGELQKISTLRPQQK